MIDNLLFCLHCLRLVQLILTQHKDIYQLLQMLAISYLSDFYANRSQYAVIPNVLAVTSGVPNRAPRKTANTVDNDELWIIKSLMSEDAIRMSYSPDVIILSRDSPKKRMTALEQECNGIIFDRNSRRVLVLPPQSISYNSYKVSKINELLALGLYNVYYANDGTNVNLYYNRRKWILSTVNGSNMNAVKWETETFRTLFTHCLAQYDFTWASFVALLDKNRCYSFVFRHPEMHKYQPSCELWLIQDIDLNPNSPEYMKVAHTLDLGDDVRKQIPQQRQVNAVDTVSIHAIRASAPSDKPNFGFILRVKNKCGTAMPPQYRNLYVASILMNFLRTTLYDVQIQHGHQTSCSRFDYCVIRVCLTGKVKLASFLNYFPDQRQRCKEINKKIRQISNALNRLLSRKNVSVKESRTKIFVQAKRLEGLMNPTLVNKLNRLSVRARSIKLQKYVCHPRFIITLLKVLD